MALNISNVFVICIPFTRSRSLINRQNFVNGTTLNSVTQVRDLDIILSADLSINAHINLTYGKSLRVLGFIKRAPALISMIHYV